MGETPYTRAEVERLDKLIDDMNRERLDFVVHVGDIGAGKMACSDVWLAGKRQFARLQHKFVLIPGDNEWFDYTDPPRGSSPGARCSVRRPSPWHCAEAHSEIHRCLARACELNALTNVTMRPALEHDFPGHAIKNRWRGGSA